MNVTELQGIKVYRVEDQYYTDSIIIIQEDGEIRFYKEMEIKYSDYENWKKKKEAEEKR